MYPTSWGSIDGTVLSIFGDYFGTVPFTYVSVGDNGNNYVLVESGITIINDSTITVALPGSAAYSNQAVYLGWGSTSWDMLANAVSIGPLPVISTLVAPSSGIIPVAGGTVTVTGSDFGTASPSNIAYVCLHNADGYYSDFVATSFSVSGGNTITATFGAHSATSNAPGYKFAFLFHWAPDQAPYVYLSDVLYFN